LETLARMLLFLIGKFKLNLEVLRCQTGQKSYSPLSLSSSYRFCSVWPR